MSTYRYERKFTIVDFSYQEVETLIKLHPAMFRPIFHARYVNNIYFDSVGLKSYYDNLDGASARRKIRIRWYGQLFGLIKEPSLEIKEKQATVGRKKSFPLHPFTLNKEFNDKAIREIFRRSTLPDTLRAELAVLQATLLNHYKRTYFQSSDRKYRITVDSALSSFQINKLCNTFLSRSHNSRAIVVELKYDTDDDRHVGDLSDLFPFRATRNSKYAGGIESLLMW